MAIDPQRFNLYAYARNNPLKWVDPNGERVYLGGDNDWLRTNVLHGMVGGQEQFDRYFQISGGQVVLREGVDTSNANAGVQLLSELVNSTDNYLYFAGTDGEAAADLFQGSRDGDGNLTRDGQRRAAKFDGTIPNQANAEGTLVGTTGRGQVTLQPTNLANGDPVFAVIAYNTGAVQIQADIARGPDSIEGSVYVAFPAQYEGRGQRVLPVSLFIHESAENLVFAQQGSNMNYGNAHRAAMRREATIRRGLRITGGFAGGGQIQTNVPPRR